MSISEGGWVEEQITKEDRSIPVFILVEIENVLEPTKDVQSKGNTPDSPLHWYTFTETTNPVLSKLIARPGRETKELQNAIPDRKYVKGLYIFSNKLENISNEPGNFWGTSRLQQIMDHTLQN